MRSEISLISTCYRITMLSYETERRLKNYLVAVSEGEGVLERLRQRLCEIRDFSPCMAF